MDTIQHAYDGYVIAKAAELVTGYDLSLSVEVCSALVGALPDLVGEAERVIKHDIPWLCGRRNLPDRSSIWNWYGQAHSGYTEKVMKESLIEMRRCMWKSRVMNGWYYFRILPQYAKHLVKDRLTHTSMGAKRDWYPPSEMWRENFFKALAYCWPNWIGWAESVAVHAVVILCGGSL